MRATLLSLLLFLGFNFYNCTSSDCEFGPVHEYFDILGFNQVFHVKTDYSYHEESIELSFEEYSHLELYYDVIYISELDKHPPHLNSGWMSTLHACSPPRAGYNGSKEEAYSQIDIFTMNDYNDTILAGENINHLIELSDLNRYQDFFSVEDYLASIEGNVPVDVIYIRPIIEPNSGEDFQIKIQVELSNGESFQTETPSVTFN